MKFMNIFRLWLQHAKVRDEKDNNLPFEVKIFLHLERAQNPPLFSPGARNITLMHSYEDV